MVVCLQEASVAVKAVLPAELLEWALPEAESAVEQFIQSKRRVIKTDFPVDKVHSKIVKEVAKDRPIKPEQDSAVFLMAVLDYVSADVLKVSLMFAFATVWLF